MVLRTADPLGGDAGPDGARALLAPPVEEGGETLFLRRVRPVKLRREVVDPAVLQPFAGVAGQLLEAVDARLDAGRHAGPPDAERTDADADPGFLAFDGAVKVADEAIHIVAALGGAFAVGEAEVAVGVGVEIVVEVDAI